MCPSTGLKTPASRPQAFWVSDSSSSGRSGRPNVPVFGPVDRLVPGGRLEGELREELGRHPPEPEPHAAREEPGVRRQLEVVGGAERVLVPEEGGRDPNLPLERELVEELRARVVGERQLDAVTPEGLLRLVAAVPVLFVAVPESAAPEPDAHRVAPERPVVLHDLREEISRRHDDAEVLILVREVGPVPEEERVAVDGGIALQRELGADLRVGAGLGIRLRGGRDGAEDEAGEAAQPREEPRGARSGAGQPALSFAAGATSASPRAARRRGSTRGTARGS